MKLKEVFKKAKADGYTHAKDEYSYKGRKLDNWVREIDSDQEDYEYYPSGYANQTNEHPSNSYTFWTKI